jgi:hypothetical protein
LISSFLWVRDCIFIDADQARLGVLNCLCYGRTLKTDRISPWPEPSHKFYLPFVAPRTLARQLAKIYQERSSTTAPAATTSTATTTMAAAQVQRGWLGC